MLTVLEIIKKTTEFLARKGIEAPRLNAELLIGHALGLKRMALYMQFERLLEERELELIRPLVKRRGLQEPVQYILGQAEFHGLCLKVDPRVLIPRPETEQFVERVIAACQDRPPARILELGVGSGAIALTLARAFPSAGVVATDVDAGALALAGENAVAAGLADRLGFVLSDWWTAVPPGPYEVIISNPPYLSAEEAAEIPVEVRAFEPARALVSPDAGMAALKTIIGSARPFLAPGGLLALETGEAQHSALMALLAGSGFTAIESQRDLAGRDRFLFARA